MPDRVYRCKADLTLGDITCWRSICKDEICLPIRMTAPFKNAARKIIADYVRYNDDDVGDVESVIDNADLALKLLVFCSRLHSSCDLTLHLDNGESITKWIPDIMTPWYSRPILHEFFKRGGEGLSDEKRALWESRYREYREWQKIRYGSYAWDYGDDGDNDDSDAPIMLPRTEIMPYQPDN